MTLRSTAGALARRTRVYDAVQPAYAAWQVARWRRGGMPLPAPSAVKRRVLRDLAREHELRVLVETGTYKADTVRALRRDFDHIYSIEVDPALHERAVRRCAGQRNATVVLGDSAVELPRVLASLDEPALLWLDAHYSGAGTGTAAIETPIAVELTRIFESPQPHVVLVDDLREFETGKTDYPSVDFVRDLAGRHGYLAETGLDMLRLLPVSR